MRDFIANSVKRKAIEDMADRSEKIVCKEISFVSAEIHQNLQKKNCLLCRVVLWKSVEVNNQPSHKISKKRKIESIG